MSLDQRFARPIGTLCMISCIPTLEAGIAAARSSYGINWTAWSFSSLGTLASVLLLLAGVFLCSRRSVGQTIANCAMTLAIPVYVLGAALGLMGGHALLYGVGYPIVIVLLLRRSSTDDLAPIAK
jgi:hypothetical protein